MQYKIYQLKDTRNTNYAFCSWKEAKEMFSIDDYKEVYSGNMAQLHILEELFEIFNLRHPEDFRGHSMSVSDVVALKKPDKDYWYWYYCDERGWEEISHLINGGD